jgi:DNA mismatch repair protein MutL
VSRAIRDGLKVEARMPMARLEMIPSVPVGAVHEASLRYGEPTFSRDEVSPLRNEIFVMPAGREPACQGFYSSLHVLGQILGCYLVCVSGRGLVLLDQHAAHERVAFEKLRHQLDIERVERQSLLIAQTVELSAGEMMLLDPRLEVLERFGFSLEPFGPNTYAIKAVPALLPEGDYTQLVRQMVAELAEVDTSARLRQHLEDRLATIACHSVIRANRKLELDEIYALLSDLDRIEFATQCPHGRPVLIEFSRDDLERMFKRVV